MKTEQKTLLLTLSEKPFEVMLSGEKSKEYRKSSDWIKSRLFNKDGTRKEYDVVKFANGYGNDKPFFVAIYNGFDICKHGMINENYSNGLKVNIEFGDFIIYLGDVIKKGNIKKKTQKQ